MDPKLKSSLMLLKRYAAAFRMKPITDPGILKQWTAARGSLVAAVFLEDKTTEAPVAWVDPDGALYIEQDEDLLSVSEPAVAVIDPELIEVAIQNKQPIHAVA